MNCVSSSWSKIFFYEWYGNVIWLPLNNKPSEAAAYQIYERSLLSENVKQQNSCLLLSFNKRFKDELLMFYYSKPLWILALFLLPTISDISSSVRDYKYQFSGPESSRTTYTISTVIAPAVTVTIYVVLGGLVLLLP